VQVLVQIPFQWFQSYQVHHISTAIAGWARLSTSDLPSIINVTWTT